MVLFVPFRICLFPSGPYLFWLTFPVTELLTTLLGFKFYRQFLSHPYVSQAPLLDKNQSAEIIRPSKPGVIVTIARQHGSSGKEIGRLVAEQLDLPFYYKEMTALAAQESGLDKEFVSGINKNAPKVLYNLYLSTKAVRLAVMAQHRIIEKIADNGSCIIVGRAADYVLQDRKMLYGFLYKLHRSIVFGELWKYTAIPGKKPKRISTVPIKPVPHIITIYPDVAGRCPKL